MLNVCIYLLHVYCELIIDIYDAVIHVCPAGGDDVSL